MTTLGKDVAVTLYGNKLSRDDFECGKVRYHRSCIFSRIFLQIRTPPGELLVERCFGNGPKLWIWLSFLSKPYFSMSLDSGSERGDNRIHSFGRLTEAWIISVMYVVFAL
jgi:hypothetical protein